MPESTKMLILRASGTRMVTLQHRRRYTLVVFDWLGLFIIGSGVIESVTLISSR